MRLRIDTIFNLRFGNFEVERRGDFDVFAVTIDDILMHFVTHDRNGGAFA